MGTANTVTDKLGYCLRFFSHKFLMLVDIAVVIESEDNIKEVEERISVVSFSVTHI